MEGMKEIARSYYERASEDEKNSIKEFFKKLDVNGDGKISLQEFMKSVTSWLSAEAVFKKLDTNGDGSLDFEEFLCLHYMEKKVNIARCCGCWDLLVGPYFSCLLCMGRGDDTYDLCCSCFRHADLSHEHSSSYMLDHHSLLMVFRNRTAAAEKSQNKKQMDELHEIAKFHYRDDGSPEVQTLAYDFNKSTDTDGDGKKQMEELREIAKSHYRAGSPEVQALAYDFYKSMDTDGDGRVNLSEFLAFMRLEGYSHMHNPYFFKELDLDGNGTLDFSEVMTLYYIIKSGRPFCNDCGNFIPGIFFSCVECFKNPDTSFDLCRDCYRSARCTHNHDGRTQFLDNYTLLQAKRDPAPAQALGVSLIEEGVSRQSGGCKSMSDGSLQSQLQSHELSLRNLYIHNSYPTYNTYVVNPQNAIVPASSTNWDKWRVALQALEVAISIGSVSATLCTIL